MTMRTGRSRGAFSTQSLDATATTRLAGNMLISGQIVSTTSMTAKLQRHREVRMITSCLACRPRGCQAATLSSFSLLSLSSSKLHGSCARSCLPALAISTTLGPSSRILLRMAAVSNPRTTTSTGNIFRYDTRFQAVGAWDTVDSGRAVISWQKPPPASSSAGCFPIHRHSSGCGSSLDLAMTDCCYHAICACTVAKKTPPMICWWSGTNSAWSPSSLTGPRSPGRFLSFSKLFSSKAGAADESFASSTLSEQESWQDWEKWIYRLLQTRFTPLGTLTTGQWDDALFVMDQIMNEKLRPTEGQSGASSSSSAVKNTRITNMGADMFTVHRLYDRLVAEEASQSAASRRIDPTWRDTWPERLLQGWLQVSAQPHVQHQSRIVLSQALAAWNMILQWYHRRHLPIRRGAGRLSRQIRHDQQQSYLDGSIVQGEGSQRHLSASPEAFSWPTIEFLDLVQAWLRLDQPDGVEMATQLLLSDTVMEMAHTWTYTQDNLEPWVAVYQTALQIHLARTVEESGGPNHLLETSRTNAAVAALLDRMQVLAQIPGWESLQPDPSTIKDMLMHLLEVRRASTTEARQADVDSSSKSTLSSFETEALLKSMIQVLDKAQDTEADQVKVQSMIEHWNGHMAALANHDMTVAFTEKVLNYYMQVVQDPIQASPWLPKWLKAIESAQQLAEEDEPMKEFTPIVVRKVCGLIELWCLQPQVAEAPWRATELLETLKQRLQKYNLSSPTRRTIEEEPGLHVKDELLSMSCVAHAVVVRRWLNSGDLTASKKALQIAFEAPRMNEELITTAVQALQLEPNVSEEQVTRIVNHVGAIWEEIPNDNLTSVIEGIARTISTAKLWTTVRFFVQYISQRGLVPSPQTSEHLASSFTEDSNSDDFLHLFHSIQMNGWPLLLRCYVQGISRFLKLKQHHNVDGCTILARGMLQEFIRTKDSGALAQGGEEAVEQQVGARITDVLDLLVAHRRETTALEILSDAEKALLGFETTPAEKVSPLPLGCFEHMMRFLYTRNKSQEAAIIFNRLKEHAKAGYADLYPSNAMYLIVMTHMSKEGGMETVPQLLELLNEMVHVYLSAEVENTSRREEFKPLEKMYNTIFFLWRHFSAPEDEVAEQALHLARQMGELNVELKDSFGISTCMRIVLNSHLSSLSLILELKSILDKAGVPADVFVHQNVLRACSRVRPDSSPESARERDLALKLALETIGHLREMKEINLGRYILLFLAMRSLLLGSTASQQSAVDTYAAAAFEVCRHDGYVNTEIKEMVRSLVSPRTWERLYTRHVRNGGPEPESWSRNITSEQHHSDDQGGRS